MKKYKCAKCGNEYKLEVPPSKCEVRPDCAGAGFFIDLTSYGELEAKCNLLQEEVSRFKTKIEKEAVPSEEKSPAKKSRLQGRGTTIIPGKISDSVIEGIPDDVENLKREISLLSVDKIALINENKSLQKQVNDLNGQIALASSALTTKTSFLNTKIENLELEKFTLKDKISFLEKRKEAYKWLFILSSISSLLFLYLKFFTN